MAQWELHERDLKKYPHFDSIISPAEAIELATNPELVAKHAFFPFILYSQRWNRFKPKDAPGNAKPKERPIRYASRRDAYIFSYYRHQISERYEIEIKRLGLENSIIAYRRIPNPNGGGGKCNINFAYDAFSTIQNLHGNQGRNGLEYLGFRYDGRHIYLRDSTLSNLCRKVVRAARREANACARRYPDKDIVQLSARFNYERLIKQFGRVENFGEKQEDFKNWTFWTYARRAAEQMGTSGRPILRQLKNHKAFICRKVVEELSRAVVRRNSKPTT